MKYAITFSYYDEVGRIVQDHADNNGKGYTRREAYSHATVLMVHNYFNVKVTYFKVKETNQ